jgi:hypothetical protein
LAVTYWEFGLSFSGAITKLYIFWEARQEEDVEQGSWMSLQSTEMGGGKVGAGCPGAEKGRNC